MALFPSLKKYTPRPHEVNLAPGGQSRLNYELFNSMAVDEG